jgi:protein arginine N-methyltransferase 1
MYSLTSYARMYGDPIRHEAYAEAMRRVVTPDSVVVDLGTGTGVYALLACQLGAKKVYALEVNPLCRIGREMAVANGFGDRIEFIEKLSTEITLPERADVIVSDLRGLTPFLGQHLPSIADARARHLKPGGVLMPRRDRIFAALATNEEAHQEHTRVWTDNPLDLDMSAAARLSSGAVYASPVRSDQLLTQPQCVWEIDYWELGSDYGMDARLTQASTQAGTAHGIGLWFEASPIEGVTYVTGPHDVEARATVYSMAFLPLPRPLDVNNGDTVDIRVRAVLDGDYIWSWNTAVRDRSGAVTARFNQSSLDGEPLSPDLIRRRSSYYKTPATERISIDRDILDRMLLGQTLGDIATDLMAQHPKRYARLSEALAYVADLAGNYA